MTTELKPSDIKKPRRFLMKFLNSLVGGGGAALQEAMNASVKTYFPSAPAGIVEGVEWVASSLAAGAIDQDQIAAFFNGIGNGAMKDVFKILFSKFGLSKFVPSGMGLPSQTVSAPQTSSRDFII